MLDKIIVLAELIIVPLVFMFGIAIAVEGLLRWPW